MNISDTLVPSSNNSYSKDLQCLKELRKLMQESGNELLVKNTWEFTDDFLLRYIRSRSYDIPSAFERVSNHMYVRRKKNPEIFDRLYPSIVYHVLDRGGASILKQRDDKGRHILYIRACHWDPDTITVDDMLLSLMILGWEMLGYKETQINGVILIIDAGSFGVKHAKHGTPGNVQKYVDLILKASPFKCKGCHILFAPMLFNMTLSLIKMFLPQKLRKRIHVHGTNLENLHNWMSPDILPQSLGGNLSETDAIDQEIVDALYSKEKDDYYKAFVN